MDEGGSGEDAFIARFFRPIAGARGALGLRDDAALITPPEGCDLVLTNDAVVAGVHFFPDDPPDAVARKALRVNLSDLAAKGAAPLGALLAFAMPKDLPGDWVEAFARGLGADADLYQCPILGGDTVSTPGPLTLSVTAFGAVPRGTFVPRTGARPGQAILVSGTIGDAALGLQLRLGAHPAAFAALSQMERAHLLDRYLNPQPRLALAGVLRAHAASAMDVSDGFAGDLAKMLAASGCGGTLQAAQVPLSPAAAAAVAVEPSLLKSVLSGGDDYEILACVPQDQVGAMMAVASALGVPLTPIGATRPGQGLDVLDREGRPVDVGTGSFSHL